MDLFNLFSNKKERKYTDAEFVMGICNGNKTLTDALYNICQSYFYKNFKKEFVKEAAENIDDIFQNSFIKLWENINYGKLYVEGGVLKGYDKEPFRGSLTTYLMSIANLKYLEWVRKNTPAKIISIDAKDERKSFKKSSWDFGILIDYDDDEERMLDVIAECISHMSERCNQIMTMFYP